ncbi:MAG: hypothetical protein NTY07_18185 [Bacteroidia bacterium]|nr:hypothetical protein [Bacteroidia bacterium]
MKRKNIILAILPIILAIFAMQSCTKKDNTTFTTYAAFTTPTVVAPANAALLKLGTVTTVDLKWACTNADSDAPLADVYFGTAAVPVLYKANVGALLLNVPVVQGLTYYWHVTMKDAHGVMTYSPTWSFTVFEPIGIFVGSYLVDEPAEAWTYTVNTTKASPTTLSMDLYWASWAATFTLDFTANTYTMAKTNFGGGYEGQESGTITPASGKMVGTYTIWQNSKVIETGTHTYTRK